MGTQAYWMKTGWRYRGFDPENEPLSWVHASTLADVREDATESLTDQDEIEVQRYNKRAEAFEPYGTLRKVRVNAKSHDHRFKFQMERASRHVAKAVEHDGRAGPMTHTIDVPDEDLERTLHAIRNLRGRVLSSAPVTVCILGQRVPGFTITYTS